MVGINTGHFCSVGIEQPALEVFDARLKRDRPRIDIQVDFIGKSARDTTLTEFSLRIHVAVELIRIAWKIGIVPDYSWIVVDSTRPGTRNDGLQLANFTILEGVGRLAEVIRKSSGKRQFV